jgi:hypothetical protein
MLPLQETRTNGETLLMATALAPHHRAVVRNPLRLALLPAVVFGCFVLSPTLGLSQTGKAPVDASGDPLEVMEASKFSRPIEITNKWLPMKPGTRYVYQGTAVEDDGKVVPHRIVINITDLVKVIGGIRTVVSYDLDYSDNELVEAELAFFAQDDEGNVWRFGEYPEEYEDGKFVKAPVWIHGYQGARAGIMMQAQPRLGAPSYAQGYGPKVGWADRGQVYQMGQDVTIGAGRYSDVLVVKESARSEGDAAQLKYYAAGLGNIKVGWTGSEEKSKEVLELVRIEQLDAKALAEVRAKALALEKSAYKRSKAVYGATRPAVAASTLEGGR